MRDLRGWGGDIKAKIKKVPEQKTSDRSSGAISETFKISGGFTLVYKLSSNKTITASLHEIKAVIKGKVCGWKYKRASTSGFREKSREREREWTSLEEENFNSSVSGAENHRNVYDAIKHKQNRSLWCSWAALLRMWRIKPSTKRVRVRVSWLGEWLNLKTFKWPFCGFRFAGYCKNINHQFINKHEYINRYKGKLQMG